MKLKKLAPIFLLAAAATLAGCNPPDAAQNNQPAPSPPAATQTAPAHKTGFSYGVHVGPHYNMSTGKIDMISIGPGIDF
ncbi:MAG: hypothetical protein EPN97_12110 [Alphaproteobacteria bacterium]|nr:MAG: hypothetical protein EPN97_12110 [Alphaproteobacteria bacterium]